MVWRLLLVCLQLASVLCEPPITCVTSPRQPRGPQSIIRGLETSGAGSVECSCGQRRSYTGNLNFVKAALSRTRPRGGGNVDVILRDCDLLRLELNFHNVAAQQPFNLRIYESDRVEINVVELSLSLLSQTRQTIVVKNVSSLHVEGRVQCRVCPENTGMLNIQMENVSRFLMTNSSVSLPLKLTGRHMQEVSIQDSTFTTLPWPGIFLHNASHVKIIRNFFLQTVPRSISISLGNLINVSHNLLDVSEALKIEQYEHQVIKCNRASPNIGLPATCNIPRLEFNTLDPEDDGVRERVNTKDSGSEGIMTLEDGEGDQQTSLEDDIRATIVREQDIIVTVLGTVDTLGLIWVLAALVIISLFILCHCCRCRSRPNQQQKPKKRSGDNLKTAAELRPDLLVIPFPGDEEGDEYSESSRVHLAMGPGPASSGLPQWVTVQGVRAEPQEDGVVCGSLTLGPSFVNKDLDRDRGESDRTVSSNILKQQAFSKV